MPIERGSRIEGVQLRGGQACSLLMNAYCAPYIRDSRMMGTRFREVVYAERALSILAVEMCLQNSSADARPTTMHFVNKIAGQRL